MSDAREPTPSPLGPATVRALTELWVAQGRPGRIAVAGGSMAPILRDGDRVRVVPGAPLKGGDVALAQGPEGLLAHRVVARRADGTVLRGDSAAAPDEPVSAAAVLGRITAIERPGALPLRGRRHRLVGAAAAATDRLGAGFDAVTAGRGRGRPRPAWAAAAGLAAQRLVPTAGREEALVLLLARGEATDEARRRAEGLASAGVDWDRVVGVAIGGQVGPLAYLGLSRLGAAGPLPEAARAALRRQYAGGWERARRSADILDELVRTLAEAGIRPLLVKGAALGLTVYPDPALRVAGDLDLVVPAADRARADVVTGPLRHALFRANPTRTDSQGFHVELDGPSHHDLDPSRHGAGRWSASDLDWAAIRARAATLELPAGAVLVPCPADLVVGLLANAVRRGFSPLRLLVDIAETTRVLADEIDWELVEAELRRTGLGHRAWIACDMAATWLDAPLPAACCEPPADLKMSLFESALVGWKQLHPALRLPTRMLWAGSTTGAVRQGVTLLGARLPRLAAAG